MQLENVSGVMRTAHTFASNLVQGTDLKLVNPLNQGKLFVGKQPHSNHQIGETSKDMVAKLSFHELSEIVFDTSTTMLS